MKKSTQGFIQRNRRKLLLALDIISITAAYLVTWIAISGRASLAEYRSLLFSSCVLFVLCFIVVYVLMGMYDSLWKYAEIYEFFRCALASVTAIAAFIAISLIIYQERRIPLSVYFISALFAASITLYTRLTYRMLRNTQLASAGQQRKRVLIVGAGDATSMLLHEIFRDPESDYNIVCAVDDNPAKIGRSIMGIKIMGSCDEIPSLVTQCDIDTILISLPAASDDAKRRILDICSKTACNMRMLPDLTKLISDGKELLSRVREVKVEDLLGRDVIDVGASGNADLAGKVVMVTGGGGSIGSELCRQAAASRPAKLIIVDIYENSAYDVEQQLLIELFSGTKACEHYRYISVGQKAREADEVFRKVEYSHLLPHVEHKDLAALRYRRGRYHEADSLRNRHKVAHHIGVSNGNGAALRYLLFKQRHHRAVRAEHVAESHRDKARLARLGHRLHYHLAKALARAHNTGGVNRLVC